MSRASSDRKRTAKWTQRRQEIMDVGARLFAAQGYTATSLDQIAEAVGVLPGSLYYYFDSKSDLLRQIVQASHDQLFERLGTSDLERLEPVEALCLVVKTHLEVALRNIVYGKVTKNEIRAIPSDEISEMLDVRRDYVEQMVALLDAGKRRRQLSSSLDPRVTARAIVSLVNSVYDWYDPGGPWSPELVVDNYTRILLNGVIGETDDQLKKLLVDGASEGRQRGNGDGG